MDKRAIEIKSILKKQYPEATFRVRIEKYSGGETIYIYTDLVKEFTPEEAEAHWLYNTGQVTEITEVVERMKKKKARNKKIDQDIHRLLKDYYHIAYDEYSGEVLLGGNTYLDILPKEG